MPEQTRAPNPHVERLALKIVENDLRRIAQAAHNRSPDLANKWNDARKFVDGKQRDLDRKGPPPPGETRRRDRDPGQDLDPAEAQWQPETVVHQSSESTFGRLVRELLQMLDGSSTQPTATYPASQGPPHATPGPWPAPPPPVTPYRLPLHDLPMDVRPMSEIDEAVLRSHLTDAVDSMLKDSPALKELYDQVGLPTVSHFLKGRADGPEPTPDGAEARLDGAETRLDREPTAADVAALTSPGGDRPPSSRRGSETSIANVAALRSTPAVSPNTTPVSPVSRRPSTVVPSRTAMRR
ncbi:hypothetical protein [Micromonospora sp. NPDC047527]|uniref:hypothetical protein n=1 Tax=unclassified Micromonospora TaxID=2617518 RepID=UPI0033D8C686